MLEYCKIDTVLGPMIAVADNSALYHLEFLAAKELESRLKRFDKYGLTISRGESIPLESIQSELTAYFAGKLSQFNTPYHLLGSSFQQQVWQALCQIPYGKTRTYAEQAAWINHPTAYRAVANANGANPLVIILPCHRIIRSNGSLGGYSGGTAIKHWLLAHEQRHQVHTE